MASSSAEWKHLSAFVSIFCLTSVASVTSTQPIKLQIWPSGTARCGENMTLLCNASSSRTINVLEFLWVRNKIICKYTNEIGPKHPCERTEETSLILNLSNITQDDEGDYICKLRAKEGMKDESFPVKIQPCPTTPSPTIQVKRIFKQTTPSSGSLVRSTCIVVGIVVVNLMMYC